MTPADLSLNTTIVEVSSPVQGDVASKLAKANAEADSGSAASDDTTDATGNYTLLAASNDTASWNSTSDDDEYDLLDVPELDCLGDTTANGTDDSEDVYEAVLAYVEAHNSTANSTLNSTSDASSASGNSVLLAGASTTGSASSNSTATTDDDDDDDDDCSEDLSADDDDDECEDDDDEDEDCDEDEDDDDTEDDDDACYDDEDEDDDEDCDDSDLDASAANGNSTLVDMSKRLSSTVNDTFGPGSQSMQMKDGEAAGAMLTANRTLADGQLGSGNHSRHHHHAHNGTARGCKSVNSTVVASYNGTSSPLVDGGNATLSRSNVTVDASDEVDYTNV